MPRAVPPVEKIQRSLATKLGLSVMLLGLATSGVAALLLDRQGRRAVDDNAVEQLEVLARALEGSFSIYEPTRRAHPVADIVAEMGRHPAVSSLQVFDGHGVIRHSLDHAERGRPLGQLPPGGAAVNGELEVVRYFAMRSACTSCHAGQETVGGVRIIVNRQRMQSSLFELRVLTGLTGAATVAALLLLVVLVTRRMVIDPVRSLVDTMSSAEEGDFLVRAEVRADDELGALARAFNTMLAAITDMRARELERNQEVASVAAERRLAPQLEEKNRIIEEQNRELQGRLRDLQLLQEITRHLTTTLSFDEQMAILSRLLAERLGYKEFTLMLLDRPAGLLRVAAAHGFPPSMQVEEMTFEVGEGIAGLVAQTGQSLLVQDTSQDPRYLKDKSRFTPAGSLFSVPMTTSGQVLGVINVFKAQVDSFRRDEMDLLESVAKQSALGIANARLYQATQEQALTDALTELPNRRALDARLDAELAQASRYAHPLSVLMLDVDNFKLYNDTHGHLAGDKVLRQVAQALAQSIRKTDTVARFGGEEFCVILPRQDAAVACEVGEKLRRAVRSRRYEHAETQPGGLLTISVGVATFPGAGEDAKALIASADAALYGAKRAGRDRVVTAEELLAGGGAATGKPERV